MGNKKLYFFTMLCFYSYFEIIFSHIYVFITIVGKTKLVTNFLTNECGVKYTHLNVETPVKEKVQENDPNWVKPRGVHQRNIGLSWLREHLEDQHNVTGKSKEI